jgi:predicted lipid-binding transport protein (Tim44 family)
MRVGFYAKRDRDFSSDIEETTVSEIDQKISKVKKFYPRFDDKDFLSKAQKVFEMIFYAYSKGDKATLKDLMSPRIFYAFSMAIDDRKKRKEILEGMLVRFIKNEIVDIESSGNEIFVTVKFETEQSNVLKSEDGTILEGNSDFVENRTEIWLFSRKKIATDSRWYLYEIKSE